MWITTKILWTLYSFYNIWFFIKWRLYNSYDLVDYLIFTFGYFLIFLYSESLNKLVKNTIARSSFSIIIIVTYLLAAKYHYRVKTNFDYMIFIENFNELFNKESADVILSTFKAKDIYQALMAIPLLLLAHVKWKIFKIITLNLKIGLAKLATYIILIIISPFSFGEISYIAKSAYEFHFGGFSKSDNYLVLEKNKNLFKKVIESKFESSKPNIFLVVMESFNGLYVEKKINGKFVTPVFNSLINEGLYVENFYGNSVQTIKGHYSILCSRVPYIKGKASYKADLSKLDCAPKKLKELGYTSFYHSSFHNLDFDNTKKFMKGIGFDLLTRSEGSKLTKKQQSENIWGWGIQDNLSYIQYVQNFKKIEKNKKPVFSMMSTISHHMKFNKVPNSQKYIFKNKSGKKEDFINSLHLSDKYLASFINELKKNNLYQNSIIIITGDHSYPGGEHGLYDNQVGHYEEFFRTPLLVIWKDKLSAQRLKYKTSSQVDILPTILDLIGENGVNHFVGNSILKKENNFAHLVQPYNGQFLSVVKWPYKYVWAKRKNRGFLYDLMSDPNELNTIDNDKIEDEYRKQLDYIYLDNLR